MTDLAATVRANATVLVQLKSRIDETVRHRSRSTADREAWNEACANFHGKYPDLHFPGGSKHWQAFLNRSPEEVNSAVTFLEVDPLFFGSGYQKQIIWSRLKRALLTEQHQLRLEAVVLAYLNRRVHPEFWYMVRYARFRGSDRLWDDIARLASTVGSEPGTKANWLLLARKNHPVQNWIGREFLRARSEPEYVPDLQFPSASNEA